MKYIPAISGAPPILELTRRNLERLIVDLDFPSDKVHFLLSPGSHIMVCAVEDEDHYSDREPGTSVKVISG